MLDLPKGLVAYHQSGGRLEGDLGKGVPGWFQLWPLAEIDGRNKGYEVHQNIPGYTGIGSSGGGEMLALSPSGQVVAIPFIGMEAGEAVVVADSWEAFESRIKSSRA